MRRFLPLLITLPTLVFSQKKELDHQAYDEWRRIETQLISNDGNFVAYTTEPNGLGNKNLAIKTIDGDEVLSYDRASDPAFSNNSEYLFFEITTDLFELRDLKRKKTKKKDLPKDSLGIYSLNDRKLEKVPGLKSFKVPEEWDGYLIYLYEPPTDTAAKTKPKKRNKENGYDLVVRNLSNNSEIVFPYVLDYEIAEEGRGISLVTTGNDSTTMPGVYVFDFDNSVFKPIYRAKGDYYQLAWSKDGGQLSFISDIDTTKAIQRDYHLLHWTAESDSAKTLVRNANLQSLNVNHEFDNYFSESGRRLFFQTKEFPVVQDTSILEEEIVDVEVWNYQDDRLYTRQEDQVNRDSKRGYLSYVDTESASFVQLGGPELSRVLVSNEGDGNTAIGLDDYPYRKYRSWKGFPVRQDLYTINLSNGERTLVEKAIKGNISLSPNGNYATWYERSDSAWFTYSFPKGETKQLTTNNLGTFYNEIHDTPSDPSPYGIMSWTDDDNKLLVYDRYDIWELDPESGTSKKITQDGRDKKLRYRYVKLDPEERFIKKNQKLILTGFYEGDKSEAIFSFTYGKSGTRQLTSGNYQYASFLKARDSKSVLYTKENFNVFPDLLSTDLSFKDAKQISSINPQQKDYNWGTSELFYWYSLDGERLEGMVFKPENFDPTKKYPLMVNFYEKSSDRLNSHRDPYPHRSTINYSYYTSRGYVIFNPNVNYRTGYPGESAYNCVIPGITALIEGGFIDKENIGVQGHSWGGYQVAYLITKTDMFKCAESGAPVVNMVSAYGGIRWGSGLSRMFQYERTQSRIGGSLWEYPLRYLENSPIFFSDKVNTPVLIMHNDEDGAVPWYQGIEYFVSLRRLNKPAWMLNYRGEPHWPLKIQNRIDFNVRMSQFFDYYLKGASMPKWMRDGVPAIEAGINQGYELIEEE